MAKIYSTGVFAPFESSAQDPPLDRVKSFGIGSWQEMVMTELVDHLKVGKKNDK